MKSIHEEFGFSTLKDAFKSMLLEAAKLTNEKTNLTQIEKEDWAEQCWNDYGDDIVEYLIGDLGQGYENAEEDDLICYCNMSQLCAAIKANSVSFFGWDISWYLC